jgi:DNA-directed RNA polymerase specialized sigma24 family protein
MFVRAMAGLRSRYVSWAPSPAQAWFHALLHHRARSRHHGRCHLLKLGVMDSSTALEMVLDSPPGIHRFPVQLSNITNKHLEHVEKTIN